MSVLKNAPAPESIPTYDGSGQATHPSVVRFDRPWNGFRWWMAMTPYPDNNDGFEDPSILASDDGKRWTVPPGAINPLVPAPRPGHNCDVELVYVPEEDELRLYYVEADDIAQSWVKLLRSRDGAHWIGPEIVIHDPARKYGILSPAIQRMSDGTWRMWYVDTGSAGYVCQANAVRTRSSKDGVVWAEESTEALTQPGYQIWHMTVWREPDTDTLHAVYPAYPDGTDCDLCRLFYARKSAGQGWHTCGRPIMEPGPAGAWDDFCLYRTAFFLDPERDIFQMWYGGKRRADAHWGIGYTEGSYSRMLEELK